MVCVITNLPESMATGKFTGGEPTWIVVQKMAVGLASLLAVCPDR